MSWFKRSAREPLNETMRCLYEVPLFSSLTPRELKRIEPLFHERRYDVGEVIFEQGEQGLGMYVVVSGKVRIESRRGEEIRVLGELGEGQFFGELALLDGSTRTASAVALEPSRLVGFYRTEFLDILETHGRVGAKISLELARMTGARLRRTLEGEAMPGLA